MTKYNIFFFDLDGTITDSSVGIINSVMYALRKFGIVEEDRTKLYQFIRGLRLRILFKDTMVFQKRSHGKL